MLLLLPMAYAALALVALRVVLSYKSALYLLRRAWRWADEWAQAYQYHEVPRFGLDGAENPLFRKAAAYVSSLPSLEDADAAAVVLSASKKTNGGFSLHLGPGHTARDAFLGARLAWTKKNDDRLVLRVRRHDRTRVLRPYLQHVESVADDMELKRQRRDLRLYFNTTATDGWASAAFTHPATLETVAMDPDLKARVRADLDGFLKGRAYYHRLGRVWRRTYLLYGPPGTGKSTFAAAMARFLGYDVYDMDLSSSKTDSIDLRSLLLRTTPRSLILVENLHRYLNDSMLSFMDGLSSSCGEERVMVFTMTTNGDDDKGTKDPAVLRPGRLDVHIKFTLCDFQGFKAMASNYLGLKDHKLYPQVEESFLHAGKRLLSPAELGEIMLANRGSPTRALRSVITKLNHQHLSPTTGTDGPQISPPLPHRRNTSWSSAVQHWEDDNTAEATHSAPIREFKKLYGLIKIRSRREGSFEGHVSTPQGDKER
ncbi:hypothetical protein QOZ80_3AG0230950 [Eleusine coracana subsp. coracana]|nr:hypothetical protein QOZ80_3AG0230950 [Eleusine coracana subsp. coracana]